MRLLIALLAALSLTWSSTSTARVPTAPLCARGQAHAQHVRAEGGGSKGDLQYAKARYLDPNIGRFLSLDPVQGVLSEPLSTQGFTYAHANPARFLDPDGRSSVAACANPANTAVCVAAGLIPEAAGTATTVATTTTAVGNAAVATELGMGGSALVGAAPVSTVPAGATFAAVMKTAGGAAVGAGTRAVAATLLAAQGLAVAAGLGSVIGDPSSTGAPMVAPGARSAEPMLLPNAPLVDAMIDPSTGDSYREPDNWHSPMRLAGPLDRLKQVGGAVVAQDLDEQADLLSNSVPGLSVQQARALIVATRKKGTDFVAGGSRVRSFFTGVQDHSEGGPSDTRPVSDIDIGFTNSKLSNKDIDDIRQEFESAGDLKMEKMPLVEGRYNPKQRTFFPSLEGEWFQRSGVRHPADPYRPNEPYGPSGTVRVNQDGSLRLTPPGGKP